MSPERTHLVRVFRNAAQPRSFEMFLVGRGVRLLTDDDSGWFRAEGSPAAPAVAHIALQRGADAPVEGVLYVSDGEGFEHWVLLVAARVPQYVTQTYGSGALSVGLLGTHQSGFSLQATPPPLGYRNALRCHWSVGGGSCGSGVQCSMDLADPLRPRLAFRLDRNVRDTQAFLAVVHEVDESVPVLGKELGMDLWWGLGRFLPLP